MASRLAISASVNPPGAFVVQNQDQPSVTHAVTQTATPTPGGALIRLNRGGVYLVSHDRATEKLPEVAFTTLPFILGYALRVNSLEAAETAVDRADLEWRSIEGGLVACFPADLGKGAWFFVERASALPWRR